MPFITSYWLTDAIVWLFTAGFILYKISTRNFSYWKKRGVAHVKPVPFFGNFMEIFMFRATISQYLEKLYNQFDEPYFGLYIFNKPHLVIKSPELIKSILVKDFNYFQDHLVVADEKNDSLASKMLFMVKNPEWKVMRNKLTPAFTSGKIKNMLHLMHTAGEDMTKYLNKGCTQSFEAKEICAKYSTDVIASCAFGINAHSFDRENSQFRAIGRKMFDFRYSTVLHQTAYFLQQETLIKLFKLPFFDPSVSNFMRQVFLKTINEREKIDSKRNDLIDILIQLKKQENITDEIKFEGDRIVAQAAIFYAAGFETVSSTMAFTLYELCINPTIQNRLRTEIKNSVAQPGEITYDSVKNMKYLHMVVCETLRKYPVLPFLDRVCKQDYKIPNSDLVIEKDTAVFIPLFGLHYDPKYFPDPQKYDPERFSEENKNKIPAFTFIPFGEGPRICIGERFGLLSTKLGLIRILSEFEVVKCEETPIPIKFEVKGIVLASNVGLPMEFKKPTSISA